MATYSSRRKVAEDVASIPRVFILTIIVEIAKIKINAIRVRPVSSGNPILIGNCSNHRNTNTNAIGIAIMDAIHTGLMAYLDSLMNISLFDAS